MPNFKRNFQPGGTYFFTVVTHGRRHILQDGGIALLRRAIRECLDEYPFTIDTMVVLPDHLHAIWTLPEGDAQYPKRWGKIKSKFTKAWLASGGTEGRVTPAHQREGRRGVWAPRFWEHTIRDERDLKRHMDYIHFNPVKHRYVRCPHEWPASSFHRSVQRGLYEADWGCCCRQERTFSMSFDDLERTVGEDSEQWS